jgi:hypothetical protein
MPKGLKLGGRQKGTPNRATVERQMEAARAIVSTERERGFSMLYRIASLCEGAAAASKPTLATELTKGASKNEDGDWGRFHGWVTLWAATAREITKYQQPQIKPVDAPAPPPDPNKQQDEHVPRRFSLRVFEGGRPLSQSSTATG